jgi:hypothetical protein
MLSPGEGDILRQNLELEVYLWAVRGLTVAKAWLKVREIRYMYGIALS